MVAIVAVGPIVVWVGIGLLGLLIYFYKTHVKKKTVTEEEVSK